MSHYCLTSESNESFFLPKKIMSHYFLLKKIVSHYYCEKKVIRLEAKLLPRFLRQHAFTGGMGGRGRRRNRQATQIYSCQSKTWGAPTVPRFVDPSHTKKRTVSSRGRPCRDASSQTPVTPVFFIALRFVRKCRITNWRSQLEVEVALIPHPPSRTTAPDDFASHWLKTFSTMCVL